MPKRRRNISQDAEGTRRSAVLRRALRAGLLNAPKPDRRRGGWRISDKRHPLA